MRKQQGSERKPGVAPLVAWFVACKLNTRHVAFIAVARTERAARMAVRRRESAAVIQYADVLTYAHAWEVRIGA